MTMHKKHHYRELLSIGFPIIIGQLGTIILGFADTLMIGHHSTPELAAAGLVNNIFGLVFVSYMGFTYGLTPIIGRLYGEERTDIIGQKVRNSFLANMLTGGIFTLALILLYLNLAHIGQPEELLELIRPYFLVNLASVLFMGIFYTMKQFLDGIGQTKVAMWAMIGGNIVNILGNWVLIYGKLGAPMLGCAGAAVATLISRAFEVAVLCVYATVSRRLPLMPRALLHPGRVIAKDFAKYALPVVCNECLWSLAFSLYTVIMGHMDNNTPILSAYTIAGNLQRMMTPASFAAGGAAAVLIGREIGRGNRGSVQRKAWVLDALALVVGFVCMGIIALVRNVLLRPYILPLMHMEGEACDIAMYMMGILMLVQPVSSVSLTNIVGVLRGGGDVRYAMLCDVGPLYAVCLPLAALAALVWKLDIRYVYPLMSIDVIVQIFLCFPRLRSGRWIHDVTRGAGELEA